MGIQLSATFKNLETWSLDQIPLKTTPSEAQNEWNKWNVIHIVSCIFSPLLITIPLIFHANRKMAEAKAQEKAALGLDAYRRKDWQGAIEHLEHLNEAPVKDIFKRKVEEKLLNTPSLLNCENEARLGAQIANEAEEALPRSAQFGTVIYPSDVLIVDTYYFARQIRSSDRALSPFIVCENKRYYRCFGKSDTGDHFPSANGGIWRVYDNEFNAWLNEKIPASTPERQETVTYALGALSW